MKASLSLSLRPLKNFKGSIRSLCLLGVVLLGLSIMVVHSISLDFVGAILTLAGGICWWATRFLPSDHRRERIEEILLGLTLVIGSITSATAGMILVSFGLPLVMGIVPVGMFVLGGYFLTPASLLR